MYFSRTFKALNFEFQIQGLSRTFKVRANPVTPMKKIYNSYCFLVEIGAKYSNILSRVKRDAFILPKTHLHAVLCTVTLGSFSKSRRRRQRERQQTKGLMSRTMVLHVRFDSLYISLPSSAKQQREMTKFYVFWSTGTAMANFSCLPLELNAVITYLA